jgi:hypothetical protein
MQMQQMPPVFGHPGQGTFLPNIGMQPILGMPAQELLVEEDIMEQEVPQVRVAKTSKSPRSSLQLYADM